MVIPATETGLEGTYTFNTNYNTDGTLQSLTYPAAGGLAAEAVTYGYGELLRPTTMGLQPVHLRHRHHLHPLNPSGIDGGSCG